MIVLSAKVNAEFEVDHEKRDQFLNVVANSKAVEYALERAKRSVGEFSPSCARSVQ